MRCSTCSTRRGEGLGAVVGKDGHRPLRDDRPPVVLLVDEVHRGAADPHAGGDDRLVHVVPEHALPAERRQQGGMDVDDPPAECRHDVGGHETHVAREHDEVDLVLAQQREQPGGAPGLVERHGGDAVVVRPLQGTGGRVVAGHEHDVARPLVAERGKVAEQRPQVGAAARGQRRDPHRHAADTSHLVRGE